MDQTFSTLYWRLAERFLGQTFQLQRYKHRCYFQAGKVQQRPKKQSQGGGTAPGRQAAGPRSAEIGSKGMGFVKHVKDHYGFIGWEPFLWVYGLLAHTRHCNFIYAECKLWDRETKRLIVGSQGSQRYPLLRSLRRMSFHFRHFWSLLAILILPARRHSQMSQR